MAQDYPLGGPRRGRSGKEGPEAISATSIRSRVTDLAKSVEMLPPLWQLQRRSCIRRALRFHSPWSQYLSDKPQTAIDAHDLRMK